MTLGMAMQYRLNPPMQNTMGGANLHTPQSIFQHMMGQQNSPQQGGPWLQIPQVPALTMPWSVSALQQPDLIRFTGERNHPAYGIASLHQKRKLSTPDITDTRQAKQFITEEKMASHFQGLHISSDYQTQNCPPSTSGGCEGCSTVSTCSNSQYKINSGTEITDAVDVEQSDSRRPRLVISQELKRLQEEPLIPVSLLSKLERPSMALVLWEPPSKHLARVLPTPRNTPNPIPSLIEDGNNNNNSNNNNNNNNNNRNNNNIIDLNQSSTQLEPMEL